MNDADELWLATTNTKTYIILNTQLQARGYTCLPAGPCRYHPIDSIYVVRAHGNDPWIILPFVVRHQQEEEEDGRKNKKFSTSLQIVMVTETGSSMQHTSVKVWMALPL